MTEANIATLRREGIAVDDDNNPPPENDLNSDDALPLPSSLILGFHGINPWCQSGNFYVRRAKLKMTPIPWIQHMSHLNFFMNLYFMEHIKDLVVPDTNKRLNSDMNLSEYFCVIACCLIMDCYAVHSVRDLFLNDPITLQKGSLICLNHIISGRRIKKSTQVMSYTNLTIREFNELDF